MLPHFLCERRVDALVKDAQYGFATLIWTDSRGTVHRCLGASHFLALLNLFFESRPSKPRRSRSLRSSELFSQLHQTVEAYLAASV